MLKVWRSDRLLLYYKLTLCAFGSDELKKLGNEMFDYHKTEQDTLISPMSILTFLTEISHDERYATTAIYSKILRLFHA